MKATHGSRPELFEDRETPGDWRVEQLDPMGEGVVDVAIFSGANAEALARDYFAWKTKARDGQRRATGKLRLLPGGRSPI